MKMQKRYCDHSISINCCFSKNTKVIVKEKNDIIEKSINEIKKDDFILTLVNGEKKFTQVKRKKIYSS